MPSITVTCTVTGTKSTEYIDRAAKQLGWEDGRGPTKQEVLDTAVARFLQSHVDADILEMEATPAAETARDTARDGLDSI